MTLTFGASATIGSLRYDTHLVDLRVSMGLGPSAGSASMTIPSGVRVEAVVGDAVELSLQSNGESIDTFGGVVHRIDRSVGRVTILAVDALGRLAAIRPGQTYERQSAGDVISAFASDGGIDTGAIESGPQLLVYVADQGRTALEHTARLSAWSGAFATGEADGSLAVRPLPSGPADLALRYGREIRSIRVRDTAPLPDVVWAGSGPAGNVSEPTAHLHTTTVLPDGAPTPGPRTVRRAAPALRTPSAASGAIEGTAIRNGSAVATVRCWLQPQIRPGTTFEIADAPMPDSLGPWFATTVEHELGPGPRGSTRITAQRLTEGGGLLGGLLGALGGVL